MTATYSELLADTSPLHPANAVAAILLTPDDRYVLQLRDSKPGIFFPGCWGCFGGAVEASDGGPLAALQRELHEELGLELAPGALRYFSKLTFDLAFCGGPMLYRDYYEARLSEVQFARLRLGEGSEVRAFTGIEALAQLRLTPYDNFLLWLHVNRGRLQPEQEA